MDDHPTPPGFSIADTAVDAVAPADADAGAMVRFA